MTEPTYGDWTERRVTRATALGGQPDFTFAAQTVAKGPGRREIGDTVVWLGDRVLVVSTRSRNPASGLADTEEKARRWLTKTIAKASRQIDGVVRALKGADPGEVVLTSERGLAIPWDPTDVDSYIGLVVVNYTPPPDFVPAPVATTPTVVVSAIEWELLLSEIRTTSGVLNYLEDRLDLNVGQPLGMEKEVLGLFGLIDQGEEIALIGDGAVAVPQGTYDELIRRYPDWPLGSDPDDRFGFVIDAMISQAHDMDPSLTELSNIHDYLRILEILDSIPRRDRAVVGKMVIEKAELAGKQGRPRYFVTRALDDRARVLIIAHPGPRDDRREFLHLLTTVFHAKYLEVAPAPTDAITLGVATEPTPTAGRSHDYMLAEGEVWDVDEGFISARDATYADYFPTEPR